MCLFAKSLVYIHYIIFNLYQYKIMYSTDDRIKFELLFCWIGINIKQSKNKGNSKTVKFYFKKLNFTCKFCLYVSSCVRKR